MGIGPQLAVLFSRERSGWSADDSHLSTVTDIDYLRHIVDESARFRAVLAATDLTTSVPTCPDWSAADLLWHLTDVQAFWAAIVADRLAGPDEYDRPERPATGLLDEFDRASASLVDALRGSADDQRAWTWAADHQHVGFVRRRQAHEALIHRLDAELTAGDRTPLDRELATDGIDEALTVMFGGLPDWAVVDESGALGQIATTDTDRSWLVQTCRWSGTSPNTGTSYESEPGLEIVSEGQPTFEISGSAADLDAWLWSRPTLDPIQRAGDTSAFDELIAAGID